MEIKFPPLYFLDDSQTLSQRMVGQSLQQLSAVYMKIDIFRMWEWAFESSSIFLFNIAWLCALADVKQTISNMLFELSFCVCTQKCFGFLRSFKDCVLENSHSWTTQLFPFNGWMLIKGIMWWRHLGIISASKGLRCLYLLHSGGNNAEPISFCIACPFGIHESVFLLLLLFCFVSAVPHNRCPSHSKVD